MRIVIDALNVTTGGGVAALFGFLPEVIRAEGEHSYIVLFARSQRHLATSIPSGVRCITLPIHHKNILSRFLIQQCFLPFMLLWLRADWLYATGNQAVLFAPCRIMLLIENANPFSSLRFEWTWLQRIRNRLLLTLSYLSSKRATIVRFLSSDSRRRICEYLGIPSEKAVVIPHGVVRRIVQVSREDASKDLHEGYVLSVSNIGPHKNFPALVEAFSDVLHRTDYGGRLVIVGDVSYKQSHEELMTCIERTGLNKRVDLVGWKEGEDLEHLYRGADILVYPSLEETFGMPVLEAMSYGIPVVVPRNPSQGGSLFLPFEEICGDTAEYFPPFDRTALASVLARLLNDPMRRKKLGEDGRKRSLDFTWSAAARSVIQEMEWKSGI